MAYTANSDRGEVALKFGDRTLILRSSFPAVAKLWPLLMDPEPEIAARRMKWLTIAQAPFKAPPPPLDRWEWHNHLLGALAGQEVEIVARAIKIFAEEHHPELTVEDVMDQSPSWGLLWRPFYDLARLFHWKPDEEPFVPKEAEGYGPFDPRKLLSALLRSQSRTGSIRPNSGT